jgi:LmbE family N-acetylglucosaminyl deacetylase
MKLKILAVGAHPDDLDFGSSGTMIKLAREGHEIYYLICTDGDKGGTNNHCTPQELVEVRRREQEEAARMIGVKEVFFLGFHDGELVPDKNLQEKIVRVIRRVRPDRIYSFDPANLRFEGFHLYHPDHRAVALAVFDAIYPAAKNRLYFPHLIDEGLEPHKVQELFVFGTHEPTHWTDITDVIEDKARVIGCHKSQFSGERAAMMVEYVKTRSRDAASGQPFEHAEAFRRIAFPF